MNIRYATGARNMQVFTSRNPASRYALLPAGGPVIAEVERAWGAAEMAAPVTACHGAPHRARSAQRNLVGREEEIAGQSWAAPDE